MRKIMLLISAGVGYVFGAKAGRERYDNIVDKANQVWGDPRVQEKVETVKNTAPEMANKATESAKSAADKAKAKVTGHETTATDGSYSNDTGSFEAESQPMGDDSGSFDTGSQPMVDDTGFGPGGDKLP